MKILVIGDLRKEIARSFQRYNALKELGHDVTGLSFFISHNKYNNINHKLLYRIFHKLGFPLDNTKINYRISDHIKKHHFDLIWIEKGLMVKPSVLRKAKTIHPYLKLLSYTEDDMFARHNQSWYYKKCLPLYDIVITTKSYNCNSEELPALGARKVFFVDKAYDKYRHRPIELTQQDIQKFGADVGFIGTYEKDRAEKMLYLAHNGIKVRIWGNGWGDWVGKHPNLQVENKPVYGDDYVKAICATKINLCFLRKINRDLQTDRTMEIPACGAFMLAERTEEHSRLFEENFEASFFDVNDPEELFEKVSYYLQHDDERQQIAKAGRQRCIESKYSHHDRLQYILSKIIG
ncbi:CgeB family protein [Desulfohalobium retbaense]|uniref:Spore protein YkvP/CgeB glycosyl transferase-like domain-containing protein n=1 Tax=Desulfohalobium retbaense (strain ATCC 49708 / DSM 5692 / JCM 16813 / HR100) TaxID=485915 RepID=C8X054_DESRD|nr:glycosyltransferase [Desulfohalobium retbaense]ACV67679.1 conserved hypothetical protein [Desulfohalobium retbaense DSM 5692]